jgi:nucleotide-binding universal stress UspA family protein
MSIAPAIKDQRFGVSPAGFTRIRAREQRRPDAPIVVGVDGSSRDQAAARTAVSMAWRLSAPVVFVYVRRGPASVLGEPYYQRRLTAEIFAGRRALGDALAMAERVGVAASGEQLAGSPARRLLEFARLRGARMLVMGSRRRRFGRSVSRRVIADSDRPVLVTGAATPVAA